MKQPWSFVPFAAAAVLAAFASISLPAAGADAIDEPVSLIVIENVPLVDALRNLARQVGGNYILDPRLQPMQTFISLRQTNVTARAALNSVLKDHKLVLVTNPVTTVARIAPASLGVKPVPASQVGTNAGAVIPLIVLDDLPLAEAVTKLAAAAKLNLEIDSQWAASAKTGPATVSFRCENITARQALAAVLDNYDLILVEQFVEDGATSVARIVVKMQRGTGPGGKIEPERKQP